MDQFRADLLQSESIILSGAPEPTSLHQERFDRADCQKRNHRREAVLAGVEELHVADYCPTCDTFYPTDDYR